MSQLPGNDSLSLAPEWPLALISLLGYLILWVVIFRSRLENNQHGSSTKLALISTPLLLLHGVFLVQLISQDSGIYLGLVNALCLIGWLIASMTISSSLYRPTINLSLFAFPIAGFSLLLVMFFPSEASPLININTQELLHIIISLIAFSILSIAAGQAIFISSLDYQLKNKLSRSWQGTFPPLQTLEKSLFEMISLGIVFLTLSIGTGFIFLENPFAQHVAHKMILSLISWVVFSALLYGRLAFGWRGTRAIQFVLAGYALLFLAFLGSKFVLEILLNRN